MSAAASRQWISSAAADVVLSLCWIPFAAATMVIGADTSSLRALMGATFVLSASHQPLTLPLVYGDTNQRKQRSKTYTLTPFVMLGLVVVGLEISLTVVALAAGGWNAMHTLQQRYGVARIYGRKAGTTSGRLDRAVLWSWLLGAGVWLAASPNLRTDMDRLALGRTNQRSIDVLVDLQGAAQAIRPVAVTAVFFVSLVWLRAEVRRPLHLGRSLYMASTAALLLTMAVAPLAGFIAYVGSHAIEYFLIVRHRLNGMRSSAPVETEHSLLTRMVKTRLGAIGVIGGFTLVAMLVMGLVKAESGTAYTAAFLTVGGLHIFYDGFIWKLRTPSLARELSISTQ